ncbi:MAG: 50S ribosomal protein P1 [Thaumarchaeota archaeon]|nr:50S ribosomal protein P1 [Nitrososphaerota archaeon]
MEYVYAALMLHRLGKEVNEDSMKKIVEAAGAKPDNTKIKALVTALGEVNIDEALKTAMAAPVAAPAAPAAAGGATKTPAAKEEKKEEEGKAQEEALSGLSSLFG